MSYLSMMESTLPPGFRFHPRDEELVCDYLAKKINGSDGTTHGSLFDDCPALVSVDLNKCEPWDLPENACVGGKEWYFYRLRDRKYATGQRTNRATISGYWKATGKDKHITRNGDLVGMRKTLVFYQGRAPKGTKTDWVMHEFRMESSDHASKLPLPKFDFNYEKRHPVRPDELPSGSRLHANLVAKNRCKLIDVAETGQVVAEGTIASTDPTAMVHSVPLGKDAVKVWVDFVRVNDALLWRPTSECTYMEDAFGTTVAWPAAYVIGESSSSN